MCTQSLRHFKSFVYVYAMFWYSEKKKLSEILDYEATGLKKLLETMENILKDLIETGMGES